MKELLTGMKFIDIVKENLNKIPVKIIISGYILVVIISIVSYAYFSSINKEDPNKHHHKIQTIESHNQQEYFYTCPMHPTVKSDKPGVCPICNMKLVKKKITKDHSKHLKSDKEKKMNKTGMTVNISPTEQVMANIKTALPTLKTVHKEIEAFGIITYDTNKLSKLPTWIGGRLDRLYIKSIGDVIHKNEIIAKIYSPELIATQKEYLYSLQNLKEIRDSNLPELLSSYKETIRAAQQRLKYFGLTDDQILSIKSLNDIKDNIPIYSKYSGTVIDINVFEGNYVKEGEILFTLADYSTVWCEAQLNETEISDIKLNQAVDIYLDSFPGKVIKGRINFIYPFMEGETRSGKIRIKLSNYNFKLMPDMYARIVIKSIPKKLITIPKSAVLNTGKNAYVWVEKDQGSFEMTHLKLGGSYDNVFEVLEGLKPEDKVAISGGFLLDSEAQLSSGMSGGHKH